MKDFIPFWLLKQYLIIGIIIVILAVIGAASAG